MGLFNYADQLGKRVEEKRQVEAAKKEMAKEAQDEAAKAEKQHKENKEQGMI
jgi:hypothetical protein